MREVKGVENTNKMVRFESKIVISPESIKKLNEQFALCDIRVCYDGDNRNYSSINKELIESKFYSMYGIPIVGEFITKDDGSKDFGTHGGRIVLDDKGMRFEETTKPYGFVTREAADNARWVTLTELDGHTTHDYIELKGCILWLGRYPELECVLEEEHPQSMEISVKDWTYRSDGVEEITDFVFSALCILGSDVTPCFESASIGRHYDLDSMKKDFAEMKSLYDSYSLDNKNDDINSQMKGEVGQMDFTKISEILGGIMLGETEVAKYALVSVSDTSICVIDREDYKAYSIPCTIADEQVVIDFDNKTACALASAEGEFSFMPEVEVIKKSVEDSLSVTFAETYENKIAELTKTYAELKTGYDTAMAELETYRAADAARKEAEKKAEIDSVMAEFDAKIGRSATYLCWKAKMDYSKSVEDYRNELTVMAGEILMREGDNAGKASFAFNPISAGVINKGSNLSLGEDRYGSLLSNFVNMDD